MNSKTARGCLLALSTAWLLVSAQAASVTVPNGNFETIPPDPNLDGDNSYRTGDTSPPWNGDGLYGNLERFTNPSTFQSGWQLNGGAGANGRYGLQQPRSGTGAGQLFYQRDLPAGSDPAGNLVAPFEGNFIAFVNMDDVDGFQQSVQSGVIGALEAGTYTLTVAVGARAGANWNDVKYDISLVASPVAGTTGTSGGTVLGTPASVTLVPLTATVGNNAQDLTYSLTLNPGDPNIGLNYAIRIDSANTFIQNGVPDPGAPINGGANARFTQGNFDNVRLDFTPVPEPSSVALVLCGLAIFGARAWRGGRKS
jgi:hypothetical protein